MLPLVVSRGRQQAWRQTPQRSASVGRAGGARHDGRGSMVRRWARRRSAVLNSNNGARPIGGAASRTTSAARGAHTCAGDARAPRPRRGRACMRCPRPPRPRPQAITATPRPASPRSSAHAQQSPRASAAPPPVEDPVRRASQRPPTAPDHHGWRALPGASALAGCGSPRRPRRAGRPPLRRPRSRGRHRRRAPPSHPRPLSCAHAQAGAVALPLGSGFAVGLATQGDIKGWCVARRRGKLRGAPRPTNARRQRRNCSEQQRARARNPSRLTPLRTRCAGTPASRSRSGTRL